MPHIAFAVQEMREQVNSLQADKADLEARISQLEQQLEHERDERAKKQYEGYEADKITGTAMVSKAIQTAPVISTEEPKIVSNKAIQTAPVISTEEPKIVSNTTEELTPVHPSALTLFKSKKGKAQYQVNYQGETTLMTRKEFREKFPGEKPPTYTPESTVRKSLGNKIRRRISQKFRDQKNDNKKRSSINLGHATGNPPPITELRKTRTIKNLMIFFMKKYMEKGEDGLPVKMDNDPEVTDDEYEERVKEEYRRKPKDYELLLMKSIRSENSQKRKRKNPEEEAAENKKKRSPARAGEKGNESGILASGMTKSSKNFFTKNPEAAPVRVRNKRTATAVRANQPTEENILDNCSGMDNSRSTGTKKQVEMPQYKEISERDSWITNFEEYFPDLDNFSSLDDSIQLSNNWIKEEDNKTGKR